MSKGINPAGAEHNKCDILKQLLSAIRLCKLIGDIPQQLAKRDAKKKKNVDAAHGTGNSMPGAIVSDKTSSEFLPRAGVLRLWLRTLTKMAKSCLTCTPSEIFLS